MSRLLGAFAASLILLSPMAQAEEQLSLFSVSLSDPQPPVVPSVPQARKSTDLGDIAERLSRLEAENDDLRSRLNGLSTGGSARTVISHGWRENLSSSKPTGLFAQKEYIRWSYRQPGLEYGISDIGGVQDRGAVGSVLAVDGEYDHGWRGTIGYRFDKDKCNCLFNRPELLFTYTDFNTSLSDNRIGSLRATYVSSDNSENDDTDNTATGTPNTITPDDRATSATADVYFKYNVYDIEFAQSLALTPTLTCRISGGARAAVMEEDFDVVYTGGDFQVPYRAFRDWEYTGGGAFIGSKLDWAITKNFGLNFGAKTGLLLGRYESRHFFPDDEPGVPTDVRQSGTRVNPFMEISGGLECRKQFGNYVVSMGAGYEMVNWFNMADSRTFSDSHMEGQNVNSVRDLSLDGMYARIGLNY